MTIAVDHKTFMRNFEKNLKDTRTAVARMTSHFFDSMAFDNVWVVYNTYKWVCIFQIPRGFHTHRKVTMRTHSAV